MKIYTGTGDRGMTGLFSGERVSKGDLRIEAYGVVDELNSSIGMIASSCEAGAKELIPELRGIQSSLLNIGAWLATTPRSSAVSFLKPFKEQSAGVLERAIDKMEEHLSPLKSFILPGGHFSSSSCHLARCICRRAERRVVKLVEGLQTHEMPEDLKAILLFLNRLSDYLFVLARYCNRIHGIEDILWKE